MDSSVNIQKMYIKTTETDIEDQFHMTIIVEDEYGRIAELYDKDLLIGDILYMSFGSSGNGIKLSDRFNKNTN